MQPKRIEVHRSGFAQGKLQALIDEMQQQRTRRTRIPVRSNGRVIFLAVEDIDWIESSDNHVRVHASGETHLLRQTLQSLEQSLSPTDFVRVHRSSIVNLARIREIQPWFNGDYVVVMRDGTQVKTGRGYRARLELLMR